MQNILNIIKKFIPRKIFSFFQPIYHYLMILVGAIIYRFPSKNIYVVGITGTKGKSTTTEIMNSMPCGCKGPPSQPPPRPPPPPPHFRQQGVAS
jgi:hypothetical protein